MSATNDHRSGRRATAWHIIMCATLALACAAARAQNADADRPVNPLATKQAMIQDRLNRLEDRMFRLQERLAEVEPESARKLAAALDRAGQLDVKTRMETIARMLRDTSRLEQTSQEQEALIADLDALLGVLLDRDPDAERRREELQRLEEIRRELRDVHEEQSRLRQQAADAVRSQRAARRIEAALERVAELLQRQEGVAERTETNQAENAAGEPNSADASEQEDLAAEAERLARELKRMADELGERNQQQSETEATEESGKPSAEAPSNEASDALRSGAAEMQDAAEKMQQDERAAASAKQHEALEELRRARLKLQEAKEALERQSSSPGGADEQHQLAERARKLAQKMEGSQGSPGGDQQGQQQKGQQPAPGEQNVQRAGQHMDDASQELEQSETEEAIDKQDQALEELEQARRELEEVLRQLREEEQEEVLKNIETRLNEMVAAQTEINHQTEPLHAKGQANLARADLLEAAEIGGRQAELAEQAHGCVRLLEDDGTTIVFPRVLRQVAEDMESVAGRLGNADIGTLTVETQKSILHTLQELVEAAKQARETAKQRQGGAPPQGGMGADGSAPPLVPTSAELKMLKRSQLGINGQTQAAETALQEGGAVADDAQSTLQQAARRQAELTEMAREMQERTERESGL